MTANRTQTLRRPSTSTHSSQLIFDAYGSAPTAHETDAIRELTNAYADLTGLVRVVDSEVTSGRRATRTLDLDDRTGIKAKASSEFLLDELATDRGLAWNEIARLCRVTVSAVRKWRAGESISPGNRRALARLAAFLDLLEEVGPVGEPAGWFGMRLIEHHTVTAADLYCEGRADDVLEYAQGQLTASDVLDRWNPDWRSETRAEWMIVDDPEAGRILVRRSEERGLDAS
ncbi:MAG: hypothetical protein OXE75_13525 [bacterium]|nr:hypothetical protein [bacterium]